MKNLIILNNEKNVSAEELEFALLSHVPYINEVVVYAEDNTIVACDRIKLRQRQQTVIYYIWSI